MRNQQKRMMVLAMIMAFMVMALFLPGLVSAGDLEPSAAPGSTMKTLDQIPPTWSQKLQCDGTACPRFELVLDSAAVLDKETGLVWAKAANIAAGTKTWQQAMTYCRNLNVGNRKGWRLPTVEELASLVDPTQINPALPSGHPFVNVQPYGYWSGSTYAGDTSHAWFVSMSSGTVGDADKSDGGYVWPVRGGN